MPKQIYIKDESFDPIYHSMNPMFYFKSRILSGSLMALGFVVLATQVVVPLIYFKTQDKVNEPMRTSVLGLATGWGDFEYTELKQYDEKTDGKTNVPKFFYLSIPRLKIDNAIVETNSTNLSPEDSLGHYKGSGLPGQVGTAFVYGHSVLPWFFNPKNYKTIFSTLDDLKAGDTVEVNYNNKKYTYKVESKEYLAPIDVNPIKEIKPRYLNESNLVLMTCWPAGTRSKRLLVNSTLVIQN